MRTALTLSILLLYLTSTAQVKLRGLVDTVGYAHTSWQMDQLMKRLEKEQGEKIKDIDEEKNISDKDAWRTAIAPHDDYTLAGYMYPLVLKNIKAKTIIIFGVAHAAAKLKLEKQLIFDSYTHWRGPYGNVKVSSLRELIIKNLPADSYQVNDSMQSIEHSVEAEIPFLQYYNKNVEIVSILVPYMSFDRINGLAGPLGTAIALAMKEKKLEWGKDVAILISTDAVHYGDQEWGGKNFAFYGVDTAAYTKAVEHEHKIIDDCLKDSLSSEKIKLFTEYTVKKENYKEYQWTWCGRYSVPMGLLTSLALQGNLNAKPLIGTELAYSNSLDHPHTKVDDIKGMGTPSLSNLHHWVGYPAIGFK